MRVAVCSLRSVSPYSQSKHYETPKLNKERPDDYEKRTWRDRLHVLDTGYVFIPPMAFKNCLSSAAKYLSEKIPGRGTTTFTKHFESGVLVLDGLTLPHKKADVPGEWLYVPSDGRRGGGKRVPKCFPVISEWSGKVEFNIIDDTITEDVFERHLDQAGKFIGIGRFRPEKNGYYGRFAVDGIEWQNF